MDQPNVTGDGDTSLSPAFWLAVMATGVATGLLGALVMGLRVSLQFLAFGYHSGSVEAGVEAARALGVTW